MQKTVSGVFPEQIILLIRIFIEIKIEHFIKKLQRDIDTIPKVSRKRRNKTVPGGHPERIIDKNSRDNCGHVEVSNSRILINRQTIKTLKELM